MQVFGFGIILVGAVIFIDSSHYKEFVGTHMSFFPIILIIIVGVIIILVVVGCYGSAIENSCKFLTVCQQI